MKKILLLLFITVFAQVICKAQTLDSQEFGTIIVSIPSFRYDVVDKRDNNSVYEIFLKGKNFLKRIPYTGRKIYKNQDGKAEYHIDEYLIKVPKGLYKIVIKGFENYKLANFSVGLGKISKFQIPQFRFAWEEICEGDELILEWGLFF